MTKLKAGLERERSESLTRTELTAPVTVCPIKEQEAGLADNIRMLMNICEQQRGGRRRPGQSHMWATACSRSQRGVVVPENAGRYERTKICKYGHGVIL